MKSAKSLPTKLLENFTCFLKHFKDLLNTWALTEAKFATFTTFLIHYQKWPLGHLSFSYIFLFLSMNG